MLRRAAFSPNIKERADCSAALFTADGELLVQAEHIPVHLGSMPASVRAAIDACGDRGRPGRQVILNDPFAGGTHLNDITLVAPCFVDGDARRAGSPTGRTTPTSAASRPGSIPPDATEIHAGGPAHPAGRCSTPRSRPCCSPASRTPDERRGDLDAQVGANRVGVERLAERSPGSTPFDEVRRLRRAAHARRARRRCPTAGGRSTTCSTPTGPRPTSSARPGSCVTRHDRRRRASRSTSPAPTRSGRATSTRSRR